MTKEKDKNKLLEEAQLAQTIREEETRRMLETNMKTRTGKVETEKEFAVTFVNDDNWKQIISLYKKRPDAQAIKDDVLAFASMQDAKLFFTEIAASGMEFLATRVENNKPQDDHFFSCGDSKIYAGTFAQIIEQLQNARKLETSPENQAKISSGIEYIKSVMPKNDINPATDMRSKLQKFTETDLTNHADKTQNPFK